MDNERKNSGFTLIELMIVVAIIAVVASIAIPKLMSTRIAANENAALATLRSLATAQAQIVSACAIDADADGGGEFAYIGELVGVASLRIYDVATGAPGIGVERLAPPILPTPFGDIVVDANGHGVVERAGYYFKMWLPAAAAGGAIAGVPEDGTAGVGGADAANLPDSSNGEILWCCYAWPVDAGVTGSRAFFINQEGDLLQFLNADETYDDIVNAANIPAFDAAYSDGTGGLDMGARLGITAQITADGEAANDGNTWTVVGN
ncbi:MAG: prepilin-type N-terminal cleavage/methylation domain-containing protein [Planctomycetota bacterium]